MKDSYCKHKEAGCEFKDTDKCKSCRENKDNIRIDNYGNVIK